MDRRGAVTVGVHSEAVKRFVMQGNNYEAGISRITTRFAKHGSRLWRPLVPHAFQIRVLAEEGCGKRGIAMMVTGFSFCIITTHESCVHIEPVSTNLSWTLYITLPVLFCVPMKLRLGCLPALWSFVRHSP